MENLTIPQEDVRKLLSTGSGDAALLYLYIHTGGSADAAAKALNLSDSAVSCAAAVLRQLGMWPEDRRGFLPTGQRPSYSQEDVRTAMETDVDFRSLVGEVERLRGKVLTPAELEILLGFMRYLGMSAEVVCILVNYCKDRARQQGRLRPPSLQAIEKEAYQWAERGIETLEDASAFIQAQNLRNSRLGKLKSTLQIYGRSLTAAEEKYADKWLGMNFDESAIALAYERTCLNTGGLNWPYMNKILTRWHEQGWHTAEEVNAKDQKPNVPKGASGEMGEAEREAIRRAMMED
ncbi:MAG: DnaD domain protein [Faecousia sp.]